MKELKKYAAIGGAIALVACWPFATGKIGEAIFKDGIASHDKSLFTIENLSYDRGYLSSTAQSRVFITDPELRAELQVSGYPTVAIIDHHISHGFLSISSSSTFALDGEPSAFMQGLKLTTESQLTGKTELLMTSQNVDVETDPISLKGIEKLSIAASQLSATIQKDGQRSVTYHIPKVALHVDNGADILINNIKGSNIGKYIDDIFIGEATIGMDSLVLNSVDGQNHNEVKGVSYTATNQIKEVKEKPAENTLTSRNKLVLAELTTDAGDKLENAVFDLSFEDLNYDGLVKVLALLKDKEAAPETVQELMLAFDLLAAQGFKVNMNEFSAVVEGSKIKSHMLFTLPEGTARASQNAETLVQTLQGDMALVMDKKLVHETPALRMQMDELLINEFAVEEGDSYRLSAKVENGQIQLLNGQTMPVFMLLSLLNY